MSGPLLSRALDGIYFALFSCPLCTIQRLRFFKRTPLYKPMMRLGITNHEIRDIVKNSFAGQAIVISSAEEEHHEENLAAINRLLSADVVGIDTETKPEYVLGKTNTNKVALVQVATGDTAILWRLYKCQDDKVPRMLQQILGNRNILKVGHAVQHETEELYRQYNIEIKNMIDTQAMARDLGSPRLALTALTAMFTGWTITKSQQRSNWERKKLTKEQISYAATDAWATLQIYHRMKRIMDILHLDLPPRVPSSFKIVQEKNWERDLKMMKTMDKVILREVKKVAKLRANQTTTSEVTSNSKCYPSLVPSSLTNGRLKNQAISWGGGPTKLASSSLPSSKSRSVTDMDTLDDLLFDIKNFDSRIWLWVADKNAAAKY